MTERYCVFLVPGDFDAPTGGYGYDRRIVAGLRESGWHVDVRSPGEGFPLPDEATREKAARIIEALPDGALIVADGLAFGALPEAAERHADRLRWIALVHHPLSLEEGLAPQVKTTLFESERRALATARHVIVTSAATARGLPSFGVPSERITVIEPGTEPAPLATGSGADGLSLLCVASVTPRKGHGVLLEALAGLRDRRWHLDCVGSLALDTDAAAAARHSALVHGLDDRVTWHGAVADADLRPLYAQADAFVLASFHEGYGMALAEALARGLPIVSSTAGAICDTVPPDAGCLVPPGDALALRAALMRLIDDDAWRAALTAGARAARLLLPTWPEAIARFDAVLQAVLAPSKDER